MTDTQRPTDLTEEQLLHRMGYSQELRRRLSGFTNFAISFTIISILAGTLTSYYIGFANGGPIIMSWGWPFVSIMCLFVALAMAELASAMPTAGGLYYWASKLGSPVWGWFTGWLNIVGFTIATAAVGWGAAVFAVALGNLWFPGVVHTTNGTIYLFFVAILITGGITNSFGLTPVRILNNVSAWWHMIGAVVVAVVLLAIPAHHQSFAFVFTKTINASGFGGHGFSSLLFWFVIGLGLLQAQYTIGGFDASAHMSEETAGASRKAARGVWTSVAVSGIFGWILLLAVTFAVPNVTGTLNAGAFDVQYIWQTLAGYQVGRVPAVHRRRRASLLRHRRHHVLIPDHLGAVQGQGGARPPPMAPSEQAPGTGLRHLARCSLRHPVDAADLRGRRDRVPRRDVHYRDRPVQRLCRCQSSSGCGWASDSSTVPGRWASTTAGSTRSRSPGS